MRWYSGNGDPRYNKNTTLVTLDASGDIVPMDAAWNGTPGQNPTFKDKPSAPFLNRGKDGEWLGITYYPNDPSRSQFWLSRDNGKTFIAYPDPVQRDPFTTVAGNSASDTGFIALDVPYYRDGTWYCNFRSNTNKYGVFRSTNNGRDWVYHGPGKPVTYGDEYPYGDDYRTVDEDFGVQGFTNNAVVINNILLNGSTNIGLNPPYIIDTRYTPQNTGIIVGHNNYLFQLYWTNWEILTPPRQGMNGQPDRYIYYGTAAQTYDVANDNRWMTSSLPGQGTYVKHPADTNTNNLQHVVSPIVMPIRALCSPTTGTIVVAASDMIQYFGNWYRGWRIYRMDGTTKNWTTQYERRGTSITWSATYDPIGVGLPYREQERRGMWVDDRHSAAALPNNQFVFTVNNPALGGIGYLISNDDGMTWTYKAKNADNYGKIWNRR